MAKIFKIMDGAAYAQAVTARRFLGADIDVKDGYIHFSSAAQVAETAAKHFAARQGLMLLALEADDLGAALKWEPSRGGQLFPHLYSSLDMDRVLWARPLPWTGTQHDFPPETFA
jgi:uncharacterized protein (DUF952 family)